MYEYGGMGPGVPNSKLFGPPSQPVGSHASELLDCWLLSLRHGHQVDGPFQTSVCVFCASELFIHLACHRLVCLPPPSVQTVRPSITRTLAAADIRRNLPALCRSPLARAQ